jgi:L-malate glycosyltransferase
VRIGFVIDNLSRAGTESQLLALIRSLDRARFEPSLVLLDGSPVASRELEPTDCETIRLGVTKLLGFRAWRAAKRLRFLWRDRRPDIVQAYFLDSSYFAIPLARRLGVPAIVRVRNNLGYWLTPKHRLLNRVLRPMVDVTLTNSDAGRASLIEKDRLAPDRVASIENGVDVDRFTGCAPPCFADPVRIGCVANLRPVKNVDGLMRAARLVIERHPNAIFEVAGDGEQRPALERLHAELNLGNRFVFRGSVADVPAFLGACDAAVLPSHSEGMSNALLESMAAGRAIVATDVGANAKLVRHGVEGLIATDSRPESIAGAIVELLNDPIAARRMAAAARDRAMSEFSRAAMVGRFEAFYDGLARRETTTERSAVRPIVTGSIR